MRLHVGDLPTDPHGRVRLWFKDPGEYRWVAPVDANEMLPRGGVSLGPDHDDAVVGSPPKQPSAITTEKPAAAPDPTEATDEPLASDSSSEVEPHAEAATKPIREMTVAELRVFARDRGIPLAAGVTRREHILGVLDAAGVAI